MVFQNTGRRRKTKFYFGTQILELAQSYKYLGTTITNTGSFKLNEVNLKKKGLRAAFIISKNIGMFAAPSSSIKIFEKVVEPILILIMVRLGLLSSLRLGTSKNSLRTCGI